MRTTDAIWLADDVDESIAAIDGDPDFAYRTLERVSESLRSGQYITQADYDERFKDA